MKKSYFLSLLFTLFFISAYSQADHCVSIVADPVKPICAVGESRVLRAAPPIGSVPRQTSSYTVAPIPFAWKNQENAGDATKVEVDDRWSNVSPTRGGPYVNLRANQATTFNFCFYGEKYNKCLIGDNGVITFGILGDPDSPSGTYTPAGFCPWNITDPIPNTGHIRNAIFGVYQDMLVDRFRSPPPLSEIPAGTDISFYTTGIYPCRAFVAAWNDVPLYSGGCSADLQSAQIILYETTNIIEVHVRKRTSCNAWPTGNGGRGTIGIQDQTGINGLAAPGRNADRFSVTNEAWRFTPSGANVPISYRWYEVDPGGTQTLIGNSQSITVSPTVETLYRVDAVFGTCDPTIPPLTRSDFTTIKIGELPINPPINMTHCDSDLNASVFNVGANIPIIYSAPGLDLPNTEAYFYTDPAEALANSFVGVLSTLENDTTTNFTMPASQFSQMIYISVKDGVANCSNVVPFELKIINCKIDMDVCDLLNDNTEDVNLLNYVPLIDASNTANGLNPADYSITFHNTRTDADNVSTRITSLSPFTVIDGQEIFVRAEKISDPTNYVVKSLVVKLRPNPDVTILGTTTVCAGATAPIEIRGLAGSSVTYSDNSGPQPPITIPAGGVYTFNTPPVVSGSYTYTIVSATFTDTDGYVCSSPVPPSVTVTVGGLPTAAFTTADQTICESDVITIDVQGTPGTIVTYTDATGSHDLNLDTLGDGVITMPTPLTPNSTYTYTLVKVRTTSTPPCEQLLSGTVTITVSLNPTATITQIDSQVCDGNVSQVQFTGTPGAFVDYTLDSNPQTPIQLDTTGSYILSEVLSPVGVHAYDLVSASMPAPSTCSQTLTGSVSITVIGAPTASIATSIPTVCSGGNTVIDFTGTPNTSVQFTINGNLQPAITLLPSTGAPTVGTYTYTSPALTADTSYQLVSVSTTGAVPCTIDLTTTAPVLVTVKPLPTATIQANQNICTGTSTTVTVTATPNSTVSYTLNGGSTVINLPINGGGTGVINTGVLTADATYTLVSVSLLSGITCQRTLNASSVVRVVPLPTASFTALPNICSNRTAEITFTGTPNATVNFTYTAGGPAIPANVLLNGSGIGVYTTIPITAVTTFNLITAVSAASGSNPSCTASISGSLTITPTAAPVINFSPTPLEVCDDNTDGIALFDLTLKNNEIIGAGSPLVITYHETQQNALDGVFPKLSPYENLVNAHPDQPPYIMWVRVQDLGGSACPSITQLRLIVNKTPQPVSPNAIEICDDTTADGFAIFPDLKIREPQMLALLDASETYTFAYYKNEIDAKASVPAVAPLPTANYLNEVAFTQTIWVRVTNSKGCFKAVSMQLIVNPNPVIPAPGVLPEYTLCDVNNTGDGKEFFNLQSQIPLITTTPGMDVKFYLDNAAVLAGTPLPLNYENVIVPAQTLIVIVQNTATGCTSSTTLTLRVKELPLIIIPATTPEICDTDGNNSGQFDLDALIPIITGGAPYTVTFHETFTNAENNVFPYTSPYENLASGIIYIRATDPTTGCYSVAPLSLIVNPIPVVPSTPIGPLEVCDDNDDQIRRVDLKAHAEPFLLPQPVAGTYDIKYFLTETDADLGTTGIVVTPTSHLAADGDVIWVRITNTATNCYNKISFKIIINPSVRFPSVEYALCDETLPNDGFTEFDLTSQNQYFGGANYTVQYYTLGGTLITNPEAYVNANPGAQTLTVVTTNNLTTCVSRSTLTIRVVPLPNPKLDPTEIVECDNDSPGDGLTDFDLTIRETYIGNLATNVSFFYYIDRNQAVIDGDQGTTFPNAIPTPTNFTSTVPYNQTIYVLVATNVGNPTAKSCYQIVELKLSVNPLPALGVNGVIKDFVACVVGSTGVNTFTLSDHNSTVIASGLTPSDYTFTYYDSQLNAEAGTATGLRPNSYRNGTNPEPIWVRVVNNTTGCVNVGTFNLVVDEAAVANPVSLTEPLLTTCDNDGTNDGSTEFNLTLFDAIILGTPAPANFTVHYYDDETEYLLDMAEGVTTTNSRAIPDILNYVVTNTKDIIAVVINRTSTTGCPARVDFTLTVNELPKVTLGSGFFCLDPVTNLPLNTFALTATVDPAAGNYTYDWTKDGAPYPVADNTTNVIQVDQDGIYSVIVTNTTTGCVSEPSNNATVEPTSTAVATATVTGYFSDNATITVNVDTSLSLGEYEFRIDEGQWQDSNVFSPVATGDHLVQIRDKNNGGCDAFVPITVTVINYPKYFTPNGDGYHDKWTIAGLGAEAKIYIFDRYGKLVKQISSDPAGGWDGTMNGQPLPSTDYWFKVEYLENNVAKEFKAHFSLKR